MKHSLHTMQGYPTILIIDSLDFRRAGVVSLLKPWADAGDLRIIEAHPHCSEHTSEPDDSYKMILLIIGSNGVGDPQTKTWITALAARYEHVPLVLVSDRAEAGEVVAALEAGVSGFIPTSIAPSVALQALAFIMSGGSFFPPAALTEATRIHRPAQLPPSPLAIMTSVQKNGMTIRQQQVLERLIQGASNKVIGRQLKLRESTVKVHVRHIMKKLGASNRTQAALCAANMVSTFEAAIVPDAGPVIDNGGAADNMRELRSFSHGIKNVPQMAGVRSAISIETVVMPISPDDTDEAYSASEHESSIKA